MSNALPILVLAAAGAACTMHADVAHAALGASVESVERDRVQLKAAIRSSMQAAYAVHTLALPGGTLLREYVGNDGIVFAVAWSGPFKPDLSQVLGSYFERFLRGERSARTTRTLVSVDEPDFVIESGGRLRAFQGRAYLPAAIPVGVTLGELR